MTTGKPKFTPDPPLADLAEISQLPLEEQVKRLTDWVRQQVFWNQGNFNRAEDWWPKDYDRRITALEGLVAYVSGTWPIVDYSFVDLTNYELVTYQDEIFLYSNTGADYYRSDSDYNDFDTPAGSTTGFGNFEGIVNNEEGQAIAWVSGSATMYRTADGITWTSFTPTDHLVVYGLVWYNDRWIVAGSPHASGYGIIVSSSTDGVTWTELHKDTSRDFEPVGDRPIATDGSRIIIAGQDLFASKKSIYISDNGGTTWVNDETVDQTSTIQTAFYGGGHWFYGAHSGELWQSTTANAGSWTKVADVSVGTDRPIEIVYGGGVWLMKVAGVSNIYRSMNATTWATCRTADPNTGGQALTYDSDNGFIYCFSTVAQHSSDGSTGSWTNTNLGSPLGFASRGVLRISVEV